MMLVGLLLGASVALGQGKAGKAYVVDQSVVSRFKEVVGDVKRSVTPRQPRKLLVYGISHGPHRAVIPTAKAIFEMLGEETGAYTAVVSDDLANFEADALKQFDAVCFANTTGEVFYRPVERDPFNALAVEAKKTQLANAERLVRNLISYVRDGGGFFGIHAATDTLKKNPAYGGMIGGYFGGHPWNANQTVRVRIEQPDHPLCRNAFPKEGFSITDEIYQMKAPYSRERLLVLTSVVVEESETPKKPLGREDKDYPLSWIKPYGEGRVFYSALGHSKSTFHNPLVLQHWLDGLQYVMGDVPVE